LPSAAMAWRQAILWCKAQDLLQDEGVKKTYLGLEYSRR
jgi:hypothetical protein